MTEIKIGKVMEVSENIRQELIQEVKEEQSIEESMTMLVKELTALEHRLSEHDPNEVLDEQKEAILEKHFRAVVEMVEKLREEIDYVESQVEQTEDELLHLDKDLNIDIGKN